jgi:hypothetical protein
MRCYAEFLVLNAKGVEDTALGTDGTLVLDGRHTLTNQIQSAVFHAQKLKFIHKYIGFQIVKGSLFDKGNPIIKKVYINQ